MRTFFCSIFPFKWNQSFDVSSVELLVLIANILRCPDYLPYLYTADPFPEGSGQRLQSTASPFILLPISVFLISLVTTHR